MDNVFNDDFLKIFQKLEKDNNKIWNEIIKLNDCIDEHVNELEKIYSILRIIEQIKFNKKKN